MTKVIVKQKKDLFDSIEIEGHADFADYGNDVVCAAISSIVFGSLNALVHYGLDENRVMIDEVSIIVNLIEDINIQTVNQTMLIQLQTIQETYPDYIHIDFI